MAMQFLEDDERSKVSRWQIGTGSLSVLEQVYHMDPFPGARAAALGKAPNCVSRALPRVRPATRLAARPTSPSEPPPRRSARRTASFAFAGLDTRRELARKLNVSPRQVQVWFQNKRQRERKISRAKGMLSTPGLPDTPATQAAIAAARKERERSGSLGPDDEEDDDGLVLPPDGGSSGSGISTASSVPTASAGASKPAAPPAAGGGSGGSNGPTSLPPPIAGVPMSRTQSLDAGTALRSGLLGGGFGSIGGVSMERAQSLEGGQLDLGSTSLDLDRIDPLGLRQARRARRAIRRAIRRANFGATRL